MRAKTGRIAGAFQALLMVMKACRWPMRKTCRKTRNPCSTYALDALKLGISVPTGMVSDLVVDAKAMKKAAEGGIFDRDGSCRLARAEPRDPAPGVDITSPERSSRSPRKRSRFQEVAAFRPAKRRTPDHRGRSGFDPARSAKSRTSFGGTALQRPARGQALDKAFGEGRRVRDKRTSKGSSEDSEPWGFVRQVLGPSDRDRS